MIWTKSQIKNLIPVTILILAGIFFAFLRLGDVTIDQTLWAEDGLIFSSQAREFGLSSFTIPHAGFLHFYQRLFAWISSFFDLQLTPLIFLGGWFLSYIAMICVIANRAQRLSSNFWEVYLIVAVIALQPSNGELFFTLTNSHTFIGVALCIYLATARDQKEISVSKSVIIFAASLTGPFAAMLMPFLLSKSLILKEFKNKKFTYFPAILGASIQIIFLLYSDRLFVEVGSKDLEKHFDPNINHWISEFLTFAFFGSESAFVKFFAITFWISAIGTLALFVKRFFAEKKFQPNEAEAVILLIFALTLYGLILFDFRSHPEIINPIGICGRYFFAPYALLFFAIWVLLQAQGRLKILFFVSLFVIDSMSLMMIQREELQFQAYAEFAKHHNNVLIKINPNWPNDRWSFSLPYDVNKEAADQKFIDLLALRKNSEIFDVKNQCEDAQYFGIEIEPEEISEDVMQIFWSVDENFSEGKSLSRIATKKVYFAFAADGVNYLKIHNLNKVKSAKLYCF